MNNLKEIEALTILSGTPLLGSIKIQLLIKQFGSGLSNIYPTENRDLARAISEKGALISEYPMETPPDRQNFPKKMLPPSEKEEIELLNKLPNKEVTLDKIMQLTKLPVMKLNILLMRLILKKVIKEYPGKIYKRKYTRAV